MFLRKIARLANLTRLPIARLQPTKFARIIRNNHFYTKTHEVIQFINDDIIRIGLSKYAIENLSEIVYIELEQIGETYEKGNEIVIIDSVKAASCICAPADGTILAHNNDVVDNIEDYNTIKQKKELDLWLLEFKISNPIDQENLMKEHDYNNFINNNLQPLADVNVSFK